MPFLCQVFCTAYSRGYDFNVTPCTIFLTLCRHLCLPRQSQTQAGRDLYRGLFRTTREYWREHHAASVCGVASSNVGCLSEGPNPVGGKFTRRLFVASPPDADHMRRDAI